MVVCLSGTLALSVTAGESSVITPGDLRAAKQELVDLRVRYTDQHPLVQQQLLTVERLEQALPRPELTQLQKEQARLEQLRLRYTEEHPAVQAQLRRVAALEKPITSGTPSELANAEAELEALRLRYKDAHPRIQAQLRKIADIENRQRVIKQ